MAKSKVVVKQFSSQPLAVAAPEPSTKWARTTIAIRPEQLQALRVVALERATARGGAAKADASELLREILDGWMRGRS